VVVPDDEPSDGDRHDQALARVRALLLDLGCTNEEIDRAVADDVVDLLVVDRMVVPSRVRLTPEQVTETTDIPLDLARRFWRALGFTDVDDDEAVFTDLDIEAVRLFQTMVAMDMVDVDSAVKMARVIGTSMARIAEAETAPGSTPILTSSGDSVIDADQFARRAGTSLPAMGRLLEYVWRRHLGAATRRAMLTRSRRRDEGISPIMAVGFADMVGFTLLSQHLDDAELGEVVLRFETLAHDTVVARGGRVVKMIGDEAMFVVQTAAGAAEIGLSLAEAYAGDQLLSDVRVALAYGPVLVQDGDFYGTVVNLASRLVAVANPGTVLISDELRSALESEGATEFTARAIRSRTLKDIGRVQAWKLSRVGVEPGADRRRTTRWERLSEVVRDLEELRDAGERVVHGSRRSDDGVSSTERHPSGSVAVEAGGGDPVAGELESSLEGSDRSARQVDQPT
jgi:adenylate cyclase